MVKNPFIKAEWKDRRLPDEYTTQKNFRTDPTVKDEFDALCAQHKLSQARVLTDAMREVIESFHIIESVQATLETRTSSVADFPEYDDPAFHDIKSILKVVKETPVAERTEKSCKTIQTTLIGLVEKAKKRTDNLNPQLKGEVEQVLTEISLRLKEA